MRALALTLLLVPVLASTPEPTAPSCEGQRPQCDSIQAAIAALTTSADPICQMLGQEAARRLADPHHWYARFETGGSGFVRIDEPAHQHDDAPRVSGVNYVTSTDPHLAGRIARHEASGLRMADSSSITARCE